MADLGDVIRDKLDAGLLPRQPAQTASRAYGDGQPCSACGVTILPVQAKYELDLHDGSTTYRFHLGCYGLWQAECRRRGWRRKDGA
jgi:hypothetical protein